MQNKSYKKILVVNPFGIGDLLFSTPLIKNLKFYYPKAKITVLTAARTAAVLENNPSVNTVIGFNRGDYKELKKKSRRAAYKKLFEVLGKVMFSKFDLCIDLSLEHRYSLFLKLLGVSPRIGYNYRKRGRFLTHKADFGGFVGKHVVEYHLGLIRFLGVKPRYNQMELFLNDKQKNKAKEFLAAKGVKEGDCLIGFAPFGGEAFGDKYRIKHWPKENYAKLGNFLKDNYRAKIVIFAGAKEKADQKELMALFADQEIIDTTDKSLIEVAAIIQNCRVMVSNDTGPLRFADALEIPTIALFGPTDEVAYGTYPAAENKAVIAKNLSCRPCYSNFQVSQCQFSQRCLSEITVDEVLSKVKQLL